MTKRPVHYRVGTVPHGLTRAARAGLAILPGSGNKRRSAIRPAAFAVALTAGPWLLPQPTRAEERQFLVILAHSPKQFGGGFPPGGLTNPQLIDRQYFDNIPNNDIDSFLEYWEEISYGDVRISPSSQRSKTTDWIILPWSIGLPVNTGGRTELDGGLIAYSPGAGERFRNDRAMSIIDLDGTPGFPSRDNGPFTSLDNPPFARGGNDTAGGLPVWMPGERFIDMDGDGRWDALDEARNEMDFFDNATGAVVSDGMPDLLGPWVDLDGNGRGDNSVNCVYLPDSDNDGNPDCCPDGPGRTGCELFNPTDPFAGACPPTTWTDEDGDTIIDCNGNLIDDAVDIASGASQDRLPVTEGAGGACDEAAQDGIPDECQFVFPPPNAFSLPFDCVETAVTDPNNGCNSVPACVPLPGNLRTPVARCEFDDANGNRVLDIVEPYENFLRRWDITLGEWVEVDGAYVDNNYPGNAQLIKNRSVAPDSVRTLRGPHDPLGMLSGVCLCSNGQPCSGGTANSNCDAGEHAQFDPPDFWVELGSTKMYNIDAAAPFDGGEILVQSTPQPSWYAQAWVDRFGTAPPAWDSFGGTPDAAATPRMIPIESVQTATVPPTRRCFDASHGGTNGRGTGWVGCGNFDSVVLFRSSQACAPGDPIAPAFDQACSAARILPEEINGVGVPLVLYDGPREFADLPSSKYHRGSDARLGEVTSPFNSDIWGQDLGRHGPGLLGGPDNVIPAAGPYATDIHGNFGRDAGNLLLMEMLTFRTDGQSATGFSDANLDGLVDQGESRLAGSENFIVDNDPFTADDGVVTVYPWNRSRLIEDCIEILDSVIDFDDFVDRGTLDQVECAQGPQSEAVPPELRGGSVGVGVVQPDGLLSGIVLLSPGGPTFPRAPSFVAVHNEDGLDLAALPLTNLPRIQSAPPVGGLPAFVPQISWNLFFHNLVTSLDAASQSGTIPTEGFQTAFAAHEYLHTWHGFPDLYDYDVFDQNVVVNCPIGLWDIMADGGLVHPVPILKEKLCTNWTEPVDLTTVVTPGVDATLTLPPAEFVRDGSYYFLENDARLGERYYFWSAGHSASFDARMPGEGMVVLHTDVGPAGNFSNPDALSQQQRSGTRPGFLIVQADGDNDLQACTTGGNTGDDGDPWPGSSGASRFNLDTVPGATWYTQNSWTGIDVLDVIPDASGSVQLTLNWVPTSIPSLRFIDPPGGQSVGDIYQVRFDATDVFGGTRVRMFFTPDEKRCNGAGALCTFDTDCLAGQLCRHDLTMNAGNLVGSLNKITPGTNRKSINWNISNVPDGRYVLFAKLNPGVGADGTESKRTVPRPGRNNVGNGTLTVDPVNGVDIDNDGLDTDDSARLETWTVTCIDPAGVKFLVTSSLAQPESLVGPTPAAAAANCADPFIACTNAAYTSPGGEVTFLLTPGTAPFALDDSFTFTTTGITSVSQPLAMINGEISAGPIARISAEPLSGLPPLQVDFNATASIEPNGDPLNFQWTFGDGSPAAFGSVVSHTYVNAGTFTVTLRATSTVTGDFGEATVDVLVVNNKPNAKISANPTSGPVPLTVAFDGTGSTDQETAASALIYQWDFGDGTTANAQANPGLQSAKPTKTYSRRADGTLCTNAATCTFVAALTVTDALGKTDTATVTLLVGNSNPKANVTASPLKGPAPLTVEFNAFSSTDADDPKANLTVDWTWDDGSPVETRPLAGNVDGSGLVRHTYAGPKPGGGPFRPTAVIKDGRGGTATWPGVDINVEANIGPVARCTASPANNEVRQPITFNASGSSDPEGEPLIFSWDFKDGTALGDESLETHAFDEPGSFNVTLTVTDSRGLTDVAVCPVTVGPKPPNRPPLALIATGLRICAATCSLTFDGSLSADPDDTPLTHSWKFTLQNPPCQSSLSCPVGFTCESGSCVTRPTGEKVTLLFQTPGTYSVVLTVTDEGNLSDDFGPQEIRVLAPGTIVVPDEDGTGRPVNGTGDPPPNSASQRPRGFCGIGIGTMFLGSLFGLTAMSMARRRNRRG